jgi:hypothetical protein
MMTGGRSPGQARAVHGRGAEVGHISELSGALRVERTMAKMPARRASGRVGQASMIWARSGGYLTGIGGQGMGNSPDLISQLIREYAFVVISHWSTEPKVIGSNPRCIPPVSAKTNHRQDFKSERNLWRQRAITPATANSRPDPSPDCYRQCYRGVCRCVPRGGHPPSSLR